MSTKINFTTEFVPSFDTIDKLIKLVHFTMMGLDHNFAIGILEEDTSGGVHLRVEYNDVVSYDGGGLPVEEEGSELLPIEMVISIAAKNPYFPNLLGDIEIAMPKRSCRKAATSTGIASWHELMYHWLSATGAPQDVLKARYLHLTFSCKRTTDVNGAFVYDTRCSRYHEGDVTTSTRVY